MVLLAVLREAAKHQASGLLGLPWEGISQGYRQHDSGRHPQALHPALEHGVTCSQGITPQEQPSLGCPCHHCHCSNALYPSLKG